MKSKSDTLKTTDKNEEQFYQFAKALIAVPKKELDKELAKHEKQKPKPNRRTHRAT